MFYYIAIDGTLVSSIEECISLNENYR